MVADTTNPAELLKIVKAAKMASSSDSIAFIVFAGHANIEDFFKVLKQECQSVQRRFLFYKDKSPCVNSSSSTNCVEQFLVGCRAIAVTNVVYSIYDTGSENSGYTCL